MTLVFDGAYFGESEGLPRSQELPDVKESDIETIYNLRIDSVRTKSPISVMVNYNGKHLSGKTDLLISELLIVILKVQWII